MRKPIRDIHLMELRPMVELIIKRFIFHITYKVVSADFHSAMNIEDSTIHFVLRKTISRASVYSWTLSMRLVIPRLLISALNPDAVLIISLCVRMQLITLLIKNVEMLQAFGRCSTSSRADNGAGS